MTRWSANTFATVRMGFARPPTPSPLTDPPLYDWPTKGVPPVFPPYDPLLPGLGPAPGPSGGGGGGKAPADTPFELAGGVSRRPLAPNLGRFARAPAKKGAS